MEKLIITAAICGAEVTKEQNPASSALYFQIRRLRNYRYHNQA